MFRNLFKSLIFGVFCALPVAVSANIDVRIVALGGPATISNVNATIGNMWCGGVKNASFTIQANHSVSCSFTHTHGVTAVYFRVNTGSPSNQKCAILVTKDYSTLSDGIHHDPDDLLPAFHCNDTDLNDASIVIHAN